MLSAGSHLAVVWIGYDDNRPTGVTGSSGSLIVWQKIMSALDTSSWQPPMPESLEDMAIDYPSGLRVPTGCSQDEVIVAVPRGTQTPFMAGCFEFAPDGAETRLTAWSRHWDEAAMKHHAEMGFAEGWGVVTDQLAALCEG